MAAEASGDACKADGQRIAYMAYGVRNDRSKNVEKVLSSE